MRRGLSPVDLHGLGRPPLRLSGRPSFELSTFAMAAPCSGMASKCPGSLRTT